MSDEDPSFPIPPTGPSTSAVGIGLPPRPDLGTDAAATWRWQQPPDSVPAPPARRSRTWLIVVAAIAIANLGGFLLLRHRGDGLPDRIGGYERLDTPQATAFEDLLSHTRVGDISFRGAIYGTDATPSYLVATIDVAGLQGGTLRSFLDDAAGGFAIGSDEKGSIDTGSTIPATFDGVDFLCAPATFSDAASTGTFVTPHGALCVWRGDGFGIVFTFLTDDPALALGQAQTVERAIDGG